MVLFFASTHQLGIVKGERSYETSSAAGAKIVAVGAAQLLPWKLFQKNFS